MVEKKVAVKKEVVAKKEVVKNEGGRPKIDLDYKTLDSLCAIQCTQDEISSIMGISVDTIERRLKEEHNMSFPEYYETKSAEGKKSLRRKQFEKALGGDTTMLIWLGKQCLNQSDKSELNQTTKVSMVNEKERRAKESELKKNPKARELLKQLAEVKFAGR